MWTCGRAWFWASVLLERVPFSLPSAFLREIGWPGQEACEGHRSTPTTWTQRHDPQRGHRTWTEQVKIWKKDSNKLFKIVYLHLYAKLILRRIFKRRQVASIPHCVCWLVGQKFDIFDKAFKSIEYVQLKLLLLMRGGAKANRISY